MEVTITNTTGEYRKAVVFGFNYSIVKHESKVPSFFDINTDDGVYVEYDGDGSIENKEKIRDKISSNPIMIESIEYTSNIEDCAIFYHHCVDANGAKDFYPIITRAFLSIKQESVFPIIIGGGLVKGIDNSTSLLFTLKPNEKITLKINEK